MTSARDLKKTIDEYYEAFQRGDDRTRFFLNDPVVMTLHPLGGRQHGWADVTAIIEAGTNSGWRPKAIRLTNLVVHVRGDVAWAVFDESADLGSMTADARVSNVYVWSGQMWLIALHHASMPSLTQLESLLDSQRSLGFHSDDSAPVQGGE